MRVCLWLRLRTVSLKGIGTHDPLLGLGSYGTSHLAREEGGCGILLRIRCEVHHGPPVRVVADERLVSHAVRDCTRGVLLHRVQVAHYVEANQEAR